MPQLYQVDTVVIGRWNPHIINPPWIISQDLVQVDSLPDADRFAMQVGISTGHGIAFQFDFGGFGWTIDFDRLVILNKQGQNTAALAAGVLAKLPHTPVTGVGNNFRYRADEQNWNPRLRTLVDSPELTRFGTITKASLGYSVGIREGLTVNVSLEDCPPMLQVSLNFHRAAKKETDVQLAAPSFESDKELGQQMIRALMQDGEAR